MIDDKVNCRLLQMSLPVTRGTPEGDKDEETFNTNLHTPPCLANSSSYFADLSLNGWRLITRYVCEMHAQLSKDYNLRKRTLALMGRWITHLRTPHKHTCIHLPAWLTRLRILLICH